MNITRPLGPSSDLLSFTKSLRYLKKWVLGRGLWLWYFVLKWFHVSSQISVFYNLKCPYYTVGIWNTNRDLIKNNSKMSSVFCVSKSVHDCNPFIFLFRIFLNSYMIIQSVKDAAARHDNKINELYQFHYRYIRIKIVSNRKTKN